MPSANLRECRVPACPYPQTVGGYCSRHRRELGIERRMRKIESAPTERYNNRTFRRCRQAFLNVHPLCAVCRDAAAVLDHIRPHRGDPSLFWDQANWQALCKRCHDAKTIREMAGVKASRIFGEKSSENPA